VKSVAATPLPDHIGRFWRSLDQHFGLVEPTWWGAVVTDGRFPAVWDANYARVDVAADDLTLPEVEASLLPALRRFGVSVEHVVVFNPQACTSLLAELDGRGHRLTWDLVMELRDDPPDDGLRRVEELRPGDELWEVAGASLALFGAGSDEALAQLTAVEREVLTPGGKRWFGVRDRGGEIVSLGALVQLGDVAYVDNVVTFERARGQGFASAVTTHMARMARSAGSAHVCLLADPDDRAVVGLYKRLGFHDVGMLAASRGAVAG